MESAWQRGAHVFCRWWIVSLANAIGISGWLHGCWTFHRISIFFFHFRCLLRAFCFAWFSLYKFHRLIFETWVCWHQLDMPILVHHSQYQHLWSKHVKTEAFVWSSRHFLNEDSFDSSHPKGLPAFASPQLAQQVWNSKKKRATMTTICCSSRRKASKEVMVLTMKTWFNHVWNIYIHNQ